jgi:hypothetical protein
MKARDEPPFQHQTGSNPDDKLTPDVVDAHRSALARGAEGYLDPRTGLYVMTAGTLRARGKCCGSGCRHCPYPADEQRAAGRPLIRR